MAICGETRMALGQVVWLTVELLTWSKLFKRFIVSLYPGNKAETVKFPFELP